MMVEPDVDLILIDGYLMTKDAYPWHRIVCRREHGPIPAGWDVHHIDGERLNNAPANLIAIPRKIHAEIHKVSRHGIPLPSREAIGLYLDWSLGGRKGPSPLRPKRSEPGEKKAEKKRKRKLSKKERKRVMEERKRRQPAEVYGPWRIERYEYQPPNRDSPKLSFLKQPKKFEAKSIRRPKT